MSDSMLISHVPVEQLDLGTVTRLYNELQEREAKLRRLIESNIIGIFIWESEGRILDANDAFLQMLGYDRDDLAAGNLRLSNLTPSEWRVVYEKCAADLNRTGVSRPYEKEYFTKNGARVPVLVGAATFDETHEQGITFVLDLTERKQAEEALRRSEAFLAHGQNLSKTGSFSWRGDNEDIKFSAQLYRLFELEQDLPLCTTRILTRVHPEDVPLFKEKLKSARDNEADQSYEIRLLMPDGRVKHCTTLARTYRHQDGSREYFGAMQDITEQRRSELALSELRSQLAHAARVTSLGTFAASIAHELSQPLAALSLTANTCLRMLSADAPDVAGALTAARRIISDSNRAAQVLTRLRTLIGKKESIFEEVDLNDATREVIALMTSTLQSNRVVLRTELTEDAPIVRGDRVQLQQVILNLVQNAIDSMANVVDRSRHLTIRTERKTGDKVRFMIQDAGIGLQPGADAQLFEPFYTTKTTGMGIGLSVSRSIIEAHDGQIRVEPNTGPGVTFSFSIPADAKDGE